MSFTAEDMYLHQDIQALRGSRGGAAFIVSTPDRDSDTYLSRLWHLAPGAEQPRALSAAEFGVQTPIPDPQARSFAFLSNRGERGRGVHVLTLGQGEARRLPDRDGHLSAILQWAGDCVLVLERVPWEEAGSSESKDDSAPVVLNFLPWKRDGGDPLVGSRTRLVALPVNGDEPRVVLEGDFEVTEAQISPDALTLVCLRREGGRQRHRDLLVVGAADGSDLQPIESPLYSMAGLTWSPDGRWVACVGARDEGDSMKQLWLYEPDTSSWSCPLPDLELEGSDLVWRHDGRALACVGAAAGLFKVGFVELDAHELHWAQMDEVQVSGICACGDGALLCAFNSPLEGAGVALLSWSGVCEKRFSEFNAWVESRRRPRFGKRTFKVPDGTGGQECIDVWLLDDPECPDPKPTLVDFHGGPQSVALIDLAGHLHWCELCAKGWRVVLPNPVGSSSYGRDFARRLQGWWGELDLPQVEAVLDQLVEEGAADDRIACSGSSYGGYLSAWAATRSHRFRAAVVVAPVTDINSHAGTSDSGYYVTPYAMGGELSETRDRNARLSPTSHAHQAKAAVLLLQGEEDRRCPLGQSEQLFAGLVREGVGPVRMVVYPGGGHSFARSGKPSHRLDFFRRSIDWLQSNVIAQPQGARHANSKES